MSIYEHTESLAHGSQELLATHEPNSEERARHAERRHVFWRERCLQHAKTIDRQTVGLHESADRIRLLESALRDLLESSAGADCLLRLARGQGTETEDGRAWANAAKLLGIRIR